MDCLINKTVRTQAINSDLSKAPKKKSIEDYFLLFGCSSLEVVNIFINAYIIVMNSTVIGSSFLYGQSH